MAATVSANTFLRRRWFASTPPPQELELDSVEVSSIDSSLEDDDDWGEMTSEAIQKRCASVAPRNVLYRHPILRRFYLIFFVLVTLFFLVPLWTLLYIPRRNRPRTSWPLKRCLRVRWSRRLCAVVARCEIDYMGRDLSEVVDPTTLEWSHPISIRPAPSTWLVGHPADMLERLHLSRGAWRPHFVHRYAPDRAGAYGRWNPGSGTPGEDNAERYGFEPVTGFWYSGRKTSPNDPPPTREPGDPVLLLFHGGGYVCGTAHERDLTSSIAKAVAQHTPVRHVLSVDYRLAPKGPWPLPLLDAISSYHHLVAGGVAEADILLGGDSAGGHLALALTRWLRDEGPRLRLRGPRAVLALSPWSDIGFSNQWGAAAFRHNAESDTIDNTFGPFASSLLLRALDPALMHQSTYLSPASQLIAPAATGRDSFENFPPMFVVYGDAERLSTEINELFTRLQLARSHQRRTPEVADKLVAGPDAVHDFMIFPHFSAEAGAVYEQMDLWLRGLFAGEDTASDEESEQVQLEATLALSPQLAPTNVIFSPELVAAGSITASPALRAAMARRSSSLREAREARLSRRASYMVGKSPRMAPYRDSPTNMVADMRTEGLNLVDINLEDVLSPILSPLSPFTVQHSRGAFDWDMEGDRDWHEGIGSEEDGGEAAGEEEDDGAMSDFELEEPALEE